MLNAMIGQMGFSNNPILLPYQDLVSLTQQLRGFQAAGQSVVKFRDNIEDYIGRFKVLTGRDLLEG